MNFNFKKLAIAAIVLGLAVILPASSNGKTKDSAQTIELTSENTVSIHGEIDPESVAQAINSLRSLDAKESLLGDRKPIYMFMYTPGGDVQAGLELIEAIHGLHRPVHTVTLFAASMGWQIVQNGGERYVLNNGILMSHRAAGGFQGSFGGKAPSQLDARYGFWLRRIQELDEQTVRRTKGKQTMESYQNQYANEMWLTGSQAVEQGYADSVVIAHCGKGLNGNNTNKTVFMGVNVTYETSKCPLITAITNISFEQPGEKTKKTDQSLEELKSKLIEHFDPLIYKGTM